MAHKIWLGGDSAAPNDASVAANYSPSGVPTTGDTLSLLAGQGPDGSDYDITEGLTALAAVDLVSFNKYRSFSGLIGSPTAPLQLGSSGTTIINIGIDDIGGGAADASRRVFLRIDPDAASVVNVYATATSGVDVEGLNNKEPARFTGGHSGTVVNTYSGRIGAATNLPTDTFQFATWNNFGAIVRFGYGVTKGAVKNSSGQVVDQSTINTVSAVSNWGTMDIGINASISAINSYAGICNVTGIVSVGSLSVRGGTAECSAGTVTNLTLLGGSTTTARSSASRTIGTVNMYPGVTFDANPAGVTFTNGIVLFERQEVSFVRL